MNKYYRRFFNYTFFALLLLSFISGCDQDDSNGNGNGSSYSVKNSVGHSANDLLSDEKFSKLVVEIAYMPGVQLRQSTIDETKAFLEERLNKPDGVDIITREVPSGGKSQYAPEDLRDYEDENRTVFPDEDAISIWVCIVDGEYVTSNVLGVAYYNLSCALMGETIANNSGGLNRPSREKIETTIMHHELGHLLGLVDVGTPMVENHKGQEAHCNNSNCLMYHSVETTEFMSALLSQPVPKLDDKCLADLKNNGGK